MPILLGLILMAFFLLSESHAFTTANYMRKKSDCRENKRGGVKLAAAAKRSRRVVPQSTEQAPRLRIISWPINQ